jgi:hypothetical protein
MNYDKDVILPMLKDEIQNRTKQFENLTQEDEMNLVKLSQDQKRIVADLDKK